MNNRIIRKAIIDSISKLIKEGKKDEEIINSIIETYRKEIKVEVIYREQLKQAINEIRSKQRLFYTRGVRLTKPILIRWLKGFEKNNPGVICKTKDIHDALEAIGVETNKAADLLIEAVLEERYGECL